MTTAQKLAAARERLANLERTVNQPDLEAQYFPLGVGFKRGAQRRAANRRLEKRIDQAVSIRKLEDEIARLEAQLDYPRRQAERDAHYYERADEMQVGERVYDIDFKWCEVVRVNQKTVTIKASSGYTEARKPTFILRSTPRVGPAQPKPLSAKAIEERDQRARVKQVLDRERLNLRARALVLILRLRTR